jgi:mannose-6-phosphate isomerase
MKGQLYPLKFSPILKNKIWGGTKLANLFQKESLTDNLGESWELSGYKGDESVVVNGFLAGKNLTELIEIYADKLVGQKIIADFGTTFPLLFKLIDANDNLSIQVHPGDEIALKRHNSFGKTEMWYVVDAEPDGCLTIGFQEDCSKEIYTIALNNGNVESLLQKVSVSKGDVFFIPAGLVHAIGKGVVIAEIQQSSDITYRIYDYNRKDDAGYERELHTKEALDVIDFSACKQPKTAYRSIQNEVCELVKCNYFTTNLLEFTNSIVRDYSGIDSFVIYMCLSGSYTIKYTTATILVNKGDTILIPACISEVKLIPEQESKLLEVYI